MDWKEIYKINDVNVAYNYLEENIITVLVDLITMKKIQPNCKLKNWVSEETNQMIKDRNEARNKAVITDNQDDWSYYKKIRNKVTEKLRFNKKSYFEKMYSDANQKNDTRTLYRITREQLGWVNTGPPTSLISNGQYISKPKVMADCLNEFFINKIQSLKQKIPRNNKDPLKTLKKAIENWKNKDIKHEFKLNWTLLKSSRI